LSTRFQADLFILVQRSDKEVAIRFLSGILIQKISGKVIKYLKKLFLRTMRVAVVDINGNVTPFELDGDNLIEDLKALIEVDVSSL